MTAVASTTNTPLLDTASSINKTATGDASSQQDRFMKLLVAQLNNQDPMNPMDNAQITSQTAQISTVSGIQQLNDTIKSMATQFASMQVLQGASLIGRDVLSEDGKLPIANGVGKGAVDLASNADKVAVQILSAGGQVLDTINLGALNAGRQSFEWDASKHPGLTNLSFKVTATQGGTNVQTTSLARDTITSVVNNGTSMSIQLQSGKTIAYDAVKAIL